MPKIYLPTPLWNCENCRFYSNFCTSIFQLWIQDIPYGGATQKFPENMKLKKFGSVGGMGSSCPILNCQWFHTDVVLEEVEAIKGITLIDLVNVRFCFRKKIIEMGVGN